MTRKTRSLIALIVLSLFDAVIPVPVVGIILIIVLLQKPPWFLELVHEVYDTWLGVKSELIGASENEKTTRPVPRLSRLFVGKNDTIWLFLVQILTATRAFARNWNANAFPEGEGVSWKAGWRWAILFASGFKHWKGRPRKKNDANGSMGEVYRANPETFEC